MGLQGSDGLPRNVDPDYRAGAQESLLPPWRFLAILGIRFGVRLWTPNFLVDKRVRAGLLS